MRKFGLTRPLGMGPFRDPSLRFKPLYGPFNKRPYGGINKGVFARKIQRVFRGWNVKRKYPVKLLAKMRRTGRFARSYFRRLN